MDLNEYTYMNHIHDNPNRKESFPAGSDIKICVRENKFGDIKVRGKYVVRL